MSDRLIATGILKSEFLCHCDDHECVGKNEDIFARPPVQRAIRMAGELFDRWLDLHNDGTALKLSSGYRCPEHNRRNRGRASSAHLDGLAFDIIPENGKIMDLVALAEMQGWYGIIFNRHRGFVHLDNHKTGRIVRGFVDGTGRYWTDVLGYAAESEVFHG